MLCAAAPSYGSSRIDAAAVASARRPGPRSPPKLHVSPSSSPSQRDPALDAAVAESDEQLRSLFAGKRQGERHPCHVAATLDGAHGAAAATVLDLAERGALLQIDDPAFVQADQHGGFQAYLELLEVHAQPGLMLTFPQQDLHLEAKVVRWTVGSAGAEPSRVGLSFTRALAAEELQALRRGTPVPCRVPSAAPPRPTHAPKPDARLQALVFLALRPEVGPLLGGLATGFGPEQLVLRVPPGRAQPDLYTLLASGALFVSVLELPHTLYESTARYTHLAPAADGGFDLTLVPRAPFPKALSKRLRRL